MRLPRRRAPRNDQNRGNVEVISGLSEIGSIGIENARMYDHLKTDYDRLIADVHHWFDFGRKS